MNVEQKEFHRYTQRLVTMVTNLNNPKNILTSDEDMLLRKKVKAIIEKYEFEAGSDLTLAGQFNEKLYKDEKLTKKFLKDYNELVGEFLAIFRQTTTNDEIKKEIQALNKTIEELTKMLKNNVKSLDKE